MGKMKTKAIEQMNMNTDLILEQKKRLLIANGVDESMAKIFDKPFQMRSFLNEKDSDETVIVIDGYIGRDMLHEYLTGEESPNTVQAFRSKLAEIKTPRMRIDINSPGGSLNDALVIYDLLKEHDAEVTTRLQGFSASAATAIALAGDKRMISENSMPLVHKAMRLFMGYMNSTNLEKEYEELKEIDKMVVRLYAEASGGKSSEADIEELMNRGAGNQGVSVSAKEYVDMGLADMVYSPGKDDDEQMTSTHEDNTRAHAKKLSMRLTINEQKQNHYV